MGWAVCVPSVWQDRHFPAGTLTFGPWFSRLFFLAVPVPPPDAHNAPHDGWQPTPVALDDVSIA